MSVVNIPLGQTVITPGALAQIPQADVLRALTSHQSGNWGDVCKEDWEENDRSLETGSRLVSVYHSTQGVKFYVITEWDRSLTTILLPEEY